MTTTLFTQKARRALGPMLRATMDAFLLGSLIAIILIYTGTVSRFPLLIVFVYALVYLIAVILRLRKATTNSPAVLSQEKNASPIDYTAFMLVKGLTPDATRTPPEHY